MILWMFLVVIYVNSKNENDVQEWYEKLEVIEYEKE